MSNVPPPPPGGFPPQQPGGFPPAAPPPPPGQGPGFGVPPPVAQPGYGQQPGYAQQPGPTPPGYVAYGQPGAVGSVRPSAGLGKATIVLFWLTVAAAGFLAFAFFRRKSVWDDFISGDFGLDDLSKIDDADSLVGAAALLQLAVELAAVIVLCIWSKRIADNAKARGVRDVSPGMAAGGWWIPIGWFFLGFNQLRKSVQGVGGTAPNLIRWQVVFIVTAIVGFVTYNFGGDINMAEQDEVADILQQQGLVGLASTVAFLIAALFATKAIREIDRAVSGS